MRTNAYQNYLENEILTADPLQLVVLLYRGTLDSIGSARRHLASGDIAARSRSISRSVDIVGELRRSLDPQRGREISEQLDRLYEYVQHRLLEANIGQVDAPLAECERLLGTLLEGWEASRVHESDAECNRELAVSYAA